jgi:hypothetical protein
MDFFVQAASMSTNDMLVMAGPNVMMATNPLVTSADAAAIAAGSGKPLDMARIANMAHVRRIFDHNTQTLIPYYPHVQVPDAATWVQVRDTCMELANTVAGLQAQLRQTRRTEEDEDAVVARLSRGTALPGMNKQEFGPVLTAAGDAAGGVSPLRGGGGGGLGGALGGVSYSSSPSASPEGGITNPLRQAVSRA